MAARIFYGVITFLFGGLFLTAVALASLFAPSAVQDLDPIVNLQYSPLTFWGGGFVVGGSMALFLRFSRSHSVWGAVWRSWAIQSLVLAAYSGIGTTFRAYQYQGLTGQALLTLAIVALAAPAVLLIIAFRLFFRRRVISQRSP